MEFDEAWPLLKEALARAGSETITREQVESGLETGRFQLFTAGRSAMICGGNGDAYRIGLAGGELHEVAALEAEATAFAKRNGFSRVEIIGREGWQRALQGYRRAAVVLRKEI